MKNYEDPRHLAHMRRVSEQRKAAAIAKKDADNAAAARKVGGQK